MRNIIIDRHIRAVFTRRGHQRTINRQRGKPIGNALLVDQADNLILVAAVVDRVATRQGGGRGVSRP